MENLIDRINTLEQRCEHLARNLERFQSLSEQLIKHLYDTIGVGIPPMPGENELATSPPPPSYNTGIALGKLR